MQKVLVPDGTATNLSGTKIYNYQQLFVDHNIDAEQAVLVFSKEILRQRFYLLEKFLPACKHHFALKSCPQPQLLEEWHNLGGYFDVASTGEIKLLQSLQIDPSADIHTHPIKKEKEIADAYAAGIRVFVVDNEEELKKFETYKKDVQLLLRLGFSNTEAKIDLSSKFGLLPQNAVAFITKAADANFTIAGLCFHVGSQMASNTKYMEALAACRYIFDELEQIGIHLSILDIGGGFPYGSNETEETHRDFFEPINNYLLTYFKDVECFSEPGRFVSAPTATLVCRVIGKSLRGDVFNYYLNEGVYGCLSNRIFDFYNLQQMQILPLKKPAAVCPYRSNIFGPTCDSFDKIMADTMLQEMHIGDTIVFHNMGAYTFASATNFNMLGGTEILVTE